MTERHLTILGGLVTTLNVIALIIAAWLLLSNTFSSTSVIITGNVVVKASPPSELDDSSQTQYLLVVAPNLTSSDQQLLLLDTDQSTWEAIVVGSDYDFETSLRPVPGHQAYHLIEYGPPGSLVQP